MSIPIFVNSGLKEPELSLSSNIQNPHTIEIQLGQEKRAIESSFFLIMVGDTGLEPATPTMSM